MDRELMRAKRARKMRIRRHLASLPLIIFLTVLFGTIIFLLMVYNNKIFT
jgi:hypothetical protein